MQQFHSKAMTFGPQVASTSPLLSGEVSFAYAAQLRGTGGTQPYSWALTAGSLPTGLGLSAIGGLSGIPTTPSVYSFTVQITDAVGSQSTPTTFGLTIIPAVSISTASLPGGTEGTLYSTSLAAAGGTAPYVWSLVAGSLDPGLSLTSGGVISGTPTTAIVYAPTFQVTDALGYSAQRALSLTIATNLAITTSSPLPSASQSSAYSQSVAASGGTAPYVWSLVSSTGVNSWNVSAAGLITGTPGTAETDTLTIKVTDAVSSTVTKVFSLSVTGVGGLQRVGMNLLDVNYFSPEQPFLNVLKSANGNGSICQTSWGTCTSVGGSGTHEEGYLQIDADGYVTSLVASPIPAGGQSFTMVQVLINFNINNGGGGLPPDAPFTYGYANIIYRVKFTGKGTIQLGTNFTSGSIVQVSGGSFSTTSNSFTSTNNGDNVFTFKVTTPTNGISMGVTAIPDSANYPRAMSIVDNTLAASFDAGAIFHPLFLAAMTNFSPFRFMTWLSTDNQSQSFRFPSAINPGDPSAKMGSPSCKGTFTSGKNLVFGVQNFTISTPKGSAQEIVAPGFVTAGTTGTWAGGGVNTGTLVGGSAYINGTYTNVPLTGGAGTGAQATIVVAGNAVSSVTVTIPGTNYATGNVLSASNTNLGGAGSGFTLTMLTTQAVITLSANAIGTSGANQVFGFTENWDGRSGVYNMILGSFDFPTVNANSQMVSVNLTYGSPVVTFNTAITNTYPQTPFPGSAVGTIGQVPLYADWAHRPQVSNCFWNSTNASNSTGSGVPYEVCIALCNQLGVDAWLCIPIWANTFSGQQAYWTSLATLLLGSSTSQKIFIEFSNEVWNSGFSQNAWAEAAGINSFFPAQNLAAAGQEWYGTQVAQIADAFRAVYGSTAMAQKVVVGMGEQFAVGNGDTFLRAAMNAPEWVAAGNTAPYLHLGSSGAVFPAPYFGVSGISNADANTILGTAVPLDTFFALAYTSTVGANTYSSVKSGAFTQGIVGSFVANAASLIAQNAGQPWGSLPHYGYESGSDMSTAGRLTNGNAAWQSLIYAAHRDNRFQYLYYDPGHLLSASGTGYLPAIKTAGYQFVCQFASISSMSTFGEYGMLENVNEPVNSTTAAGPAKYQGIMKYILGL